MKGKLFGWFRKSMVVLLAVCMSLSAVPVMAVGLGEADIVTDTGFLGVLEATDAVQLPTPTGLRWDGTNTIFEAVPEANGNYYVGIEIPPGGPFTGTGSIFNDQSGDIIVLDRSYNLFYGSGRYAFRAMARGDNVNTLDSEWSDWCEFYYEAPVDKLALSNLRIEVRTDKVNNTRYYAAWDGDARALGGRLLVTCDSPFSFTEIPFSNVSEIDITENVKDGGVFTLSVGLISPDITMISGTYLAEKVFVGDYSSVAYYEYMGEKIEYEISALYDDFLDNGGLYTWDDVWSTFDSYDPEIFKYALNHRENAEINYSRLHSIYCERNQIGYWDDSIRSDYVYGRSEFTYFSSRDDTKLLMTATQSERPYSLLTSLENENLIDFRLFEFFDEDDYEDGASNRTPVEMKSPIRITIWPSWADAFYLDFTQPIVVLHFADDGFGTLQDYAEVFSRKSDNWDEEELYFYITEPGYYLLANLPTEPVEISGRLISYNKGAKSSVPGYALDLYNSNNNLIETLITDKEGRFSTFMMPHDVLKGIFVKNPLSLGLILNSDGNGFMSADRLPLFCNMDNEILVATNQAGGGFNSEAFEIRGRVLDERGAPVSGAGIYYISAIAETSVDGSFTFVLDRDWLKYHNARFTVKKTGYHDSEFPIIFDSEQSVQSILQFGYIYTGELVMRAQSTGAPISGHVSATPGIVTRGETVQVFVHYKSDRDIPNARVTVTVDDGVDVTSVDDSSAQINGNTVTLTKDLRKDEAYTMGFWLKGSEFYDKDGFTITANVDALSEKWFLNEQKIMMSSLTLELPAEVSTNGTSSQPFNIWGNAISEIGYTIDVIFTDMSGKRAITTPNLIGINAVRVGTGYKVSDVQILGVPKESAVYMVDAYLRDRSGLVVAHDSKILTVIPDALELIRISMNSDYFNVTAPDPVNNSSYATAAAYVDEDYYGRDYIDIHTTFLNDEDIPSASYYMKTSHGVFSCSYISYSNGIYSAHFSPGSYKGSGPATIVLELTKKDGTTLKFNVGRLTLLIDPSGYVFDNVTGERIEGATATLQIKDSDAWMDWPADEYMQNNYQTTNAQGEYGWFVPEGKYRVLVSAVGYEDYSTDADAQYGVIAIPPPRLDINIGLTPIITTIPESTPSAQIDFVNERLINLIPDGSYTVNGVMTTAADGEIAIESAWLGQSISITKNGNGTTTTNSEAQVLYIPNRNIMFIGPVGVNASEEGANDGKIIGVDARLEYSANGGETWIVCSGTEITNLSAGVYYVRMRATENTFASSAAHITIAVDERIPVVTDIIVTRQPDKSAYTVGERLNLTGLVVTAKFDIGDDQIITDYSTNPIDGALLSVEGTVTVAVSYAGKTASFDIEVSKGAAKIIKITDPDDISTFVGIAPILPVTVLAEYDDGVINIPVEVIWDNIDPSKYASEGSFTINGTVEGWEPKVSIKITVIVSDPGPVPVIRIDAPALVTLRKNSTLRLGVVIIPVDATPKISWSSSNPAVASVDENGLVTAISTGTVVITAKTEYGALSNIVTIRIIA